MLSTPADRIRSRATYRTFLYAPGDNGDADSNDDIWPNSNTYTGFVTTANTATAVGSSNDTAAGSGAQQLRLYGLNENWDWTTEDVVMNGTSPTVATTTTWIRLLYAEVIAAGATGANAGTTTISIGGAPALVIQALRGTSGMAITTVPRAHYGIVRSVHFGGGSDTALHRIVLHHRTLGSAIHTSDVYTGIGMGQQQIEIPDGAIILPERTDVWMRTVDGTTAIHASGAITMELCGLQTAVRVDR